MPITVTAAATAATTPTAETATGALFAGTGFIDSDGASIEFLAVELRDGSVGFFLRSHFHERETAGLAGELVHDQFAFGDVARLLEQVEDVSFGGVKRQIPYE